MTQGTSRRDLQGLARAARHAGVSLMPVTLLSSLLVVVVVVAVVVVVVVVDGVDRNGGGEGCRLRQLFLLVCLLLLLCL